MNYVALDVETANNVNGSICSIGLAKFSHGILVDEYYSLVRPPETLGDFSERCIEVHGIYPWDVVDERSFDELYQTIQSFVENNTLVAHNAPFDSRHLQAVTHYYNLPYSHTFECSLKLARMMLDLPNYRLETVCHSLGIRLGNHHNALDDARACGEIYACLTSANRV